MVIKHFKLKIKKALKLCKFKVLKLFHTRGANQIRTGDRGVADLCLTAWPWRLTL